MCVERPSSFRRAVSFLRESLFVPALFHVRGGIAEKNKKVLTSSAPIVVVTTINSTHHLFLLFLWRLHVDYMTNLCNSLIYNASRIN